MRARPWLAVGCLMMGFASFGCSSKDDTTAPTTAAEALTKAVAFDGGKLVEGLMPDATAKGVTLLGSDSDQIEPGDSSLMAFDVSPTDSDVAGALVQFGDAGSYFLIDDSAFKPSAADGGTADGAHIQLGFKTAKDVCDKLCDTVHAVKITRAVKLRGGKVSKHESATLELDCTTAGDHALCTGVEPEVAGDQARSDAGALDGRGKSDASLVSDSRDGGAPVTLIGMMAGACESTGTPCTGMSEFNACVMSACDATYRECLGTDYQSGDYTGSPCDAYGQCFDQAADPCNADCTPTSTCDTCLMQTTTCVQGCLSLLDCSNVSGTSDGGVVGFPDAGLPNLGGTCADLDACCLTLPAAAKTQCQTAATQLRTAGDVACSSAISAYCP